MPQAFGAMCSKSFVGQVLQRLGYRGLLVANTVILGLLLFLFAIIGVRTPVWLIVLQAFAYGIFTSMQYTSMNTLAYADLTEPQTSNGSSIASTMQQLSVTFGVATAGLTTALFVPNSGTTNSTEMIHGLHKGLLLLTILSTSVFRSLKSSDGSNVSSQKLVHHG
jgi:MFS family permease